MRQKADPLWPVALVVCGLVGGTLWLEWLARKQQLTTLTVAISARTDGVTGVDGEEDLSGIPHEKLEPASPAHAELRELARRGLTAAVLSGFAELAQKFPDSASVHADYGYWLIRSERFEEAKRELARASELAPTSALLQLNLGAALHRLGDREGAIAAYRESLKRRPGYIEAELALAQALVRAGRADEALAVLEEAQRVGDAESRSRALLARGRIELDRGHVELATGTFAKAVEWVPASAALRASIARAWLHVRRLPGAAELALAAARTASQLAPSDAELWSLLGRAGDARGAADEAERAYLRATSIDPHQLFARRRLIRLALAKREFETAERHVHALLSEDAEEPEHRFLEGLVLSRSGKLGEARAAYQKAIEAAKGHYPQAYFNLGVLAKNEKKIPEAIEFYQKAIDQDAKYVEALNNLGVAWVLSGDESQAKKAYERALAVDKEYASAWINLGELEARRKNWPDAVRAFEAARAIRGTEGELEEQFGAILLRAGEFDRARGVYEALAKVEPKNAGAWAGLAEAEQKLGRADRAAEHVSRARELAPESARVLRVDASVLRAQGAFDEAAGRYGEILDQEPENTDVRLELAQVWFESRRFERCLDELSKASRLAAERPEIEIWKARCNARQ